MLDRIHLTHQDDEQNKACKKKKKKKKKKTRSERPNGHSEHKTPQAPP